MNALTTLCAGAALAGTVVLATTRTAPAQESLKRAVEPMAAAGATEYAIDSVHSMALFRVRHLGAGAFWGRFNTVTGSIQHDPASTTGLRLDVSIEIESVDSGSDSLDGHLKSPDFFNAAEFSTATFTSRSARKVGERTYEVAGDLTLHGVTKPMTVKVDWLGTQAGQRGEKCGFETTFTIKRSEFGMTYGVEQGALGDETRLVVALEANKVEAAAARDRGAGRGEGRGNIMARLDTNGDGKVQKDELPERMQERFEALDLDGDGALDAEEVRALFGRGGGRPR